MKIIGMIPVYNEADIVGYVVDHLIPQGIQLVILDNGSTDDSYEIFSRYANKGVLWLQSTRTNRYQFDLLCQKLYDVALAFHAELVLLNAADEFLESPYPRLTLSQAIQRENLNGCNMVQFDNFEFFPTEKDVGKSEADPRKRLKHYTWNDDMQFRCWKVYPGVKVTGTAGHYHIFPQ